MGQILDSPITTKRTSVHEKFLGDDKLKWVVTDMQGWRDTMEDTHVCEVVSVGESDNNKQKLGIFAVFDGHGGDATAKFIASRFVDVVSSHITNNSDDLQKAMEDTYLNLDEEWRKKIDPRNSESGCVAVSVVITPSHYIVANAGDSRLMIVRDDKVVLRTTDHKPDDAMEFARIHKAGKHVSFGRIDGLNMSRALGDFDQKNVEGLKAADQPISPLPSVQIYPRNKQNDQFLAICCDGIWDVMTCEVLSTFLLKNMRAGHSLARCAEMVLDHCLELDSKDNMTCMLVALEGAPREIGTIPDPVSSQPLPPLTLSQQQPEPVHIAMELVSEMEHQELQNSGNMAVFDEYASQYSVSFRTFGKCTQ